MLSVGFGSHKIVKFYLYWFCINWSIFLVSMTIPNQWNSCQRFYFTAFFWPGWLLMVQDWGLDGPISRRSHISRPLCDKQHNHTIVAKRASHKVKSPLDLRANKNGDFWRRWRNDIKTVSSAKCLLNFNDHPTQGGIYWSSCPYIQWLSPRADAEERHSLIKNSVSTLFSEVMEAGWGANKCLALRLQTVVFFQYYVRIALAIWMGKIKLILCFKYSLPHSVALLNIYDIILVCH